MFLPQCQRPSFALIHNHRQHYSLVYSNVYVFRQQRGDTGLHALPEFDLLLISFWVKFWFITLVPKHLNCDTFSNELFAIFMSRFWTTFWWRDNNIMLSFRYVYFRSNLLCFSL
jgi:hypothetical protein